MRLPGLRCITKFASTERQLVYAAMAGCRSAAVGLHLMRSLAMLLSPGARGVEGFHRASDSGAIVGALQAYLPLRKHASCCLYHRAWPTRTIVGEGGASPQATGMQGRSFIFGPGDCFSRLAGGRVDCCR